MDPELKTFVKCLLIGNQTYCTALQPDGNVVILRVLAALKSHGKVIKLYFHFPVMEKS